MADLPSQPVDDSFLDALIGDLRLEAARRRAAPAFPIDEEVRLGQALDEQAPASWGERLIGAVARNRRADRRAGEEFRANYENPRQEARLERRIEALERRLAGLERRATPRVTAAPVAVDVQPLVAGVAGRVLYWGADPAAAVAVLRDAGVDAYGVDPGGDRYQTGPDVRHGELVAHLRAVAGDGLGAAIVVGLESSPGPGVADLVQQLRRVAPRVVVVSEAPWHWRARLGSPQCDLAERRPLEAETWLALLDASGCSARAEYPDGASSYSIVATRS
jgi:hypothetical protein